MKFKQVAAGEDFAIALTYDGDLYGMSLLDKSGGQNGGNVTGLNSNPVSTLNTLGEYYPSTPIKIDVKFTDIWYSGTAESPTDFVIGADPDTSPDAGYTVLDTSEENRTIKSIVATRKTAAFITENNLIYTWGAEIVEPTQDSTPFTMNLLLRGNAASNPNYREAENKFLPSMINYLSTTDSSGYAVAGNTTALIPLKGQFLANVYAFTASEYNYNLFYSAGRDAMGNNDTPKNFTWGQQVYYQLDNTQTYTYDRGDDDVLTAIIGTSGNASDYLQTQAFLGDGNVYYVKDGTLYVRGKNISVTSATIGYDTTNTNQVVSGIVKTLLATDPSDNLSGAMLVSDGSYKNIPYAVLGFKQIGTSVPALTTARNVFNTAPDAFVDSQGHDAEQELLLPTFSAGAGYGYLIDGTSKVRSWGTVAGLTGSSMPLPANGTGVIYTQVVAGKILTGLPVLDGLDLYGRYINKETYETTKWATDGTELKPEFVDGKTELSAALNGSGQIEIFGVYDGAVLNKTVSVPNAKSSNNKFAAIFGGYGNNLFAVSNIGKLYRITATNDGTLD
ncbi:MAG: hypothetical protein K2M95_01555, partial [Clostridiales bacterium]|nr:hypothetical protein [Clostridiales bacterium]